MRSTILYLKVFLRKKGWDIAKYKDLKTINFNYQPVYHTVAEPREGLTTQLYGHSRQGGCGVCQGISMGSETPTTPKQFNSPFPQNRFSI